MGLVDLYRTWAQIQEQNRLKSQQDAGANWLRNYETAATPEEKSLRFSQLPNVLTDPATAEQFERRALTRDQLRLQGDQVAKAKQLEDFLVKAQDFYGPSQSQATRGQLPTPTEARQDLLAFGRDQGVSPLVVDQAAKSLESFLRPKTEFKVVGDAIYGEDKERGEVFIPKGFVPEQKPVTYSQWGYGQMRGSDGSIVSVPTAPTSGAGGATPYFTPVQTAQGVYSFDARTGKMIPAGDVVGSNSDPELQRQIAEAKAAGKEYGTAGAEAQIDLPRVVSEAKKTVNLVDDLLKHPGFSQAVGTSRIFGVQKVPGTNAKSFDVALNQIKGKQFLQAFQSLKGGGHITEIEGQKATEAISRMDAANTEQEFVAAARDFQDVVRVGITNAERKAKTLGQGSRQAQTETPTGIKFLGFE